MSIKKKSNPVDWSLTAKVLKFSTICEKCWKLCGMTGLGVASLDSRQAYGSQEHRSTAVLGPDNRIGRERLLQAAACIVCHS